MDGVSLSHRSRSVRRVSSSAQRAVTLTSLWESISSVLKFTAGLGSIVGSALFLFYCAQIRYWPAADIVALSGTFIAVSALATAIVFLLLAPPAITHGFVIRKSSSQNELTTAFWVSAVTSLGQVTAAFALCRLLLRGWVEGISFLAVALLTITIGTPAVRWLQERSKPSSKENKDNAEPGNPVKKHRLNSKIRAVTQWIRQFCKTFILSRLTIISAVSLGGLFLFITVFLFTTSDVLYRPLRASPVTYKINSLEFATILFVAVFISNLMILAIRAAATGKRADVQAALGLAAALYGAAIIFLRLFGFNSKFLALLGLGDLRDCTITVRPEAASSLAQLGYSVATQDTAHFATVSGVHVLLAVGSELVIGANPATANDRTNKTLQPPFQTATIPRSLVISVLRPPESP